MNKKKIVSIIATMAILSGSISFDMTAFGREISNTLKFKIDVSKDGSKLHTITVGENGIKDINEAIEKVANGGIVKIPSGVHNIEKIIDKNVMLDSLDGKYVDIIIGENAELPNKIKITDKVTVNKKGLKPINITCKMGSEIINNSETINVSKGEEVNLVIDKEVINKLGFHNNNLILGIDKGEEVTVEKSEDGIKFETIKNDGENKFDLGKFGLSGKLNVRLTFENTGKYNLDLNVDDGRLENNTSKETIETENIFFSKYIEGSNNNKAIEIFNGTEKQVKLSEYSVELYVNGQTKVKSSQVLNGNLQNGQTFVISNDKADEAIKAKSNLESKVTWYNGDDTLVLKHNGKIIDVIGYLGNKECFGADKTLVRRSHIKKGNVKFNESEWIEYDKDTFDNLGFHIIKDETKVNKVKALPSSGTVLKGTMVNLKTVTEGATIYYTLDGSDPSNIDNAKKYTGSIKIDKDCTIKVVAVKKGLQSSEVLELNYKIKDISKITRIRDVQGKTHRSPLEGKEVENVEGVVTAISNDRYAKGFYIQDTNEDNDDATSEGIFVDVNKNKLTLNIKPGDLVDVDGVVIEAKNEMKGMGGLTITEIAATDLKVQSHNNKLPQPIIIGEGGRKPSTEIIDSDGLKEFNPEKDAIDFYESLEGMLVQVNDPLVTGLDERYGEVYVLPDSGKASESKKTKFNGISIEKNNFNPEKLTIDDVLMPITNNKTKKFTDERFNNLKTGDKFKNPIVGVMSYGFGNYKILNTNKLPDFIDGGTRRAITKINPDDKKLTVASYNIENFSVVTDKNRIDKVAESIVKNLKAPDIVGLVEIQDNDGANSKNGPKSDVVEADKTYGALIEAIKDNGGSEYEFIDIAPVNGEDGGIPGGNIRVGYIYKKNRVKLVNKNKGDSITEVTMDGEDLAINPGRIGTKSPEFKGTRKSLAAEFEFKGEKIFVIANHLCSKRGDTSLFGATQPPVAKSEDKRGKQAEIVNNFAENILKSNKNANVIILGDINDFDFSTTVDKLKGNSFTNMMDKLPKQERFTYIHQGNSQVLDNVLVNKNIEDKTIVDAVNINSAFTNSQGRCSDHDPVLVQIDFNK